METKMINCEFVAFVWKFVTLTKLELEFIRSEDRQKQTIFISKQKKVEYENLCSLPQVNMKLNENIVHSRSIMN